METCWEEEDNLFNLNLKYFRFLYKKINCIFKMSLNSLTGAQKDELMDQVKQQIAVANAQELLTVIAQPFGLSNMLYLPIFLKHFRK